MKLMASAMRNYICYVAASCCCLVVILFFTYKCQYKMLSLCCAAWHPLYGLMWTNGKAVFLASVDIIGHKLTNVSSTQLAIFEWVFECLDIRPARRQTSALLWTSDHRCPSAQVPSPSPACHHGSYCCTVAQLRWRVSAIGTMEIVQFLKCIMCIAWTFTTSPQKPPTIYRRVNDFGPHRDSLFREGGDLYAGATYTWVYPVVWCILLIMCYITVTAQVNNFIVVP